MRKARINLYITERQKRQLDKRSVEEHLPVSELIRRALDAYLAWDDPTYAPHLNLPRSGTVVHPRHE